MIERIDDMPAGTLGFHASGEITADQYRDVLEPALQEAAGSGEIRMLYLIEPEFSMDAGAMAEDAKVGLGLGIGHHSAWKRTAVVTDVDWVRRAMHLFAWMAPGELRIFSGGEVDDAKAWVAG